jgi:parvulin-like peptidyl-prolyl isomerase
VEGTFGLGFSGKLDGLTLGDWQGPIESGLGIHLIQVQSRMEGALPDLAEIREIVEREWVNERRFEMRRAMNEMLLENYEVVIDWPTGQTEGPSDAP